MAELVEPDPRSWRLASVQVFVDDLGSPRLGDDDFHHLSRVLRLRRGERVCASDGAGSWRLCDFAGAEELDPVTAVDREAPPAYRVGIGFAPVKGDRPEWVVQKLTELGVDRIVAFVVARSVVRWTGDRAERQLGRLRAVARSSAAQSRRVRLPDVTIGDFADLGASGAVLAEGGGRTPTASDRLVLIGPEGGWTDQELGGSDTVGLGSAVLRSETAALSAGVILTALRVGLVRPHLASSHPE